MEKISITPTISLLKAPDFPFCNSLLIEDQQTALVDTGLGRHNLAKVLKKIKIDLLINSHTHPDHVAGNRIICEMTSAEIYVPEQEKGNTISLDKMKTMLGIRGIDLEPSWDKIIKDIMGFQESTREKTYGEEHVFDLGKTRLEAIHTPGHSSGHFCFMIREEELLFSSDLGLDYFGPWYGYINSSLIDYFSSIEKVRKIGVKKYLASHDAEVSYNLNEGLDRCLEIIEKRKDKIISLLKEGKKDVHSLAKHNIVYRNLDSFQSPFREFLIFFHENMIRKHLKLLLDSGDIEEKGGYYTVM